MFFSYIRLGIGWKSSAGRVPSRKRVLYGGLNHLQGLEKEKNTLIFSSLLKKIKEEGGGGAVVGN